MSINPTLLRGLDSLEPTDRLRFAKFGFGPRISVPFPCIQDAFAYQAAARPTAIAVEHLSKTITYRELDNQSSSLASRLLAMGVGPGSRVCLLVERSIPMVIGILAILKAGGAYVPLDGGIVTQTTLEYILKDADCSVIVTLRKYSYRLDGLQNHRVLTLEDILDSELQGTFAPIEVSNTNSAYVIYTSGTTGKPKGVDVTHANVTNLVCLQPGNLGMCPGMRVSQLMNISFDMAAWEILGSLCNGCTLCIRGKTAVEWRDLLRRVDLVIATPSMMAPHDPSAYPNIKVVATAGEPCPQNLADSWARAARFYDCCGPTEITIVNTVDLHVSGNRVSIGSPTPNNSVYILDEHLNPLPISEVGVLWAGGAGITRGYINMTDKTNERYKPDPFVADGSRMFNTGDLGRWRFDGKLEHLGRTDDQVKIKGFRVELDGVAASMETCPEVKSAIALLIDEELWGFVTPAIDGTDNVGIATAQSQPYYAVPSHYLTMDHFPLTPNGKIDKRALESLALKARTALHSQTSNPTLESKDTLKTDDARDKKSSPPDPSSPLPPPPVYQREKESLPSSTTTARASTVSSLEKGDEAWAGYEDDDLPPKPESRLLRNLRHQIFSLYRRLFGLVFVANVGTFIYFIVRGGTNAGKLGEVVVINIFCSILMRQDYVVNAFFAVFCAVPRSWPLSIRRICARVYHIGGLHSGCAISAILWLIFFTVRATQELVAGQKTSVATVVVTYWILLTLFGIAIFAHPSLRTVAHDQFERTHRFLGWFATALVWAQVILLTNDYKVIGQSLGNALLASPSFWLVLVMTLSIILPWVRLRKETVRTEVLSKHAIRIYFDYATPVPGSYARISLNPLTEWHSFATFAEPDKPGFSMVVSRAGDWTSKRIDDPPAKLWVRGVPVCGVLRVLPMFRRVVLVATGSGMGPCAPCVLARRLPIKLLWTSPNVRQTFGNKFVDAILAASPDAVIYDTRTHGKPDMVKLTYRLVREFDAEAVCIISNQSLTKKVVYGMMSRGIPAFGAIWDS
ncbi:hypothetical protein PLICRDRAFT_274094 [Plicaturopsis crispa FD-325 SS-3]|nr:hypothetical protein PLICRDRAFT_274094 [Plicaturopsis crispa FD-325 SS-3]